MAFIYQNNIVLNLIDDKHTQKGESSTTFMNYFYRWKQDKS